MIKDMKKEKKKKISRELVLLDLVTECASSVHVLCIHIRGTSRELCGRTSSPDCVKLGRYIVGRATGSITQDVKRKVPFRISCN